MFNVHSNYRALRILIFLVALFLVACDATAPTPPAAQDFKYVTSVEISASTDQAELEAKYGGTAFVFRPEAGFAILGFDEPGLSTQRNEDVFMTPEVASHGRGVWAGGRGVWAGGLDAWTGSTSPTLGQNSSAWDKIKLREGQALAPNLGKGVKVAVIDTGIDIHHPAFKGKLAPADEWWDFVDNDVYPLEVAGSSYGHGTGVAGIILQVAPNATILPLRVLDEGGRGDVDDVVRAIDRAVWYGADIINLSLGTNEEVNCLEMLVKYAKDRGVVVVASSGNRDEGWLEYPAQYDQEVVSVGSVNSNDIRSDFSSYGSSLDILAPGEGIYTSMPSHQLGHWTGTSFAAPMATGAFALALGDSAPHQHITADALQDKIIWGADDIRWLDGNWMFGYEVGGRLNVEAFLQDAFSNQTFATEDKGQAIAQLEEVGR